jgi:hypothetical protein
VAVTSEAVKLEEASLSAKVMVAVLPAVSAAVLLETAMVGAVVSAGTGIKTLMGLTASENPISSIKFISASIYLP